MKKLLLASTALVASAGFAYAEVLVGGDGYFGVAYGEIDGDGVFVTTEGFDGDTDDDGEPIFDNDTPWIFAFDLDIDFTATGVSDSGLTFGAAADLDDIGEGQSQGVQGFDGEIFVSGDFGTLSIGDINGGAEEIIGDLNGVGLTGLGDFNENQFLLDNGAFPFGPVVRYDYAIQGFQLSLGLTDDQGYSIGAGYATDLFSVGLAYEVIQEGQTLTFADFGDFGDTLGGELSAGPLTTDVDHIIGGASVNFNNVEVRASYGRIDIDQDGFDTVDQFGISAGASFDAISVSAYYRQQNIDLDDADDPEIRGFGIGAAYDLGGGLALEAGFAQLRVDDAEESAGIEDDPLNVADFGLSFSF